jgi:hypothetical protein
MRGVLVGGAELWESGEAMVGKWWGRWEERDLERSQCYSLYLPFFYFISRPRK